jgi:hypothetical protein
MAREGSKLIEKIFYRKDASLCHGRIGGIVVHLIGSSNFMLIFILNVKVPVSASLASARICLPSKVEIKVARCSVQSSILNLIELFLGV